MQFALTPKRPSSTAIPRTTAWMAAFGAEDSRSFLAYRVIAGVVTARIAPEVVRSWRRLGLSRL